MSLLDHVGHCRHTGGTADHHNMVDIGHGQARVLDHLVEWTLGAIQQVRGDLLELGARQGLVQNSGFFSRVGDMAGSVEACWELDSSILAFSAASRRRCRAILSLVRSMPLADRLIDEPIGDALIPVVAAELVVTCSCKLRQHRRRFPAGRRRRYRHQGRRPG